MELVLAVVAVVTGVILQRSTGLGFTLVSGPFLVLVLSPYEGVALANLLSLVTCCVARFVDSRKAAASCQAGLASVGDRRSAERCLGVASCLIPKCGFAVAPKETPG